MKMKTLLGVVMISLALVPVAAHAQTAHLAVSVADVGTLDPHFANKIGEVPIIRMVYQSLVRHPAGAIDVARLEPSLATRWEVAEDKLTWTFQLRKGVKWHEGYGEFTAEDVKFSLDRIRDETVGAPDRKAISAIESVTVVDPYTVQIKTTDPYPVLPAMMIEERFGYIISKKAAEKLGKDLQYHPVGTGPFMFDSYKPRESFTLKANQDYWDGKPKLEKVVVSFMPDDATRELALRNGEVHAVNIPAKQEWIDRLREAGFTVNLTSPANTFVLHFNLTQKPLDDKKVRMALCHAISRDLMVAFLGKDVAQAEVSPLPEGYLGHTTDLVMYPYDIDKAKQLLTEAGFKDGFKLSMNISNSNIYLPPMQVIQEMWKKIGVELELKVVDHPTYHKLIRQDANPVIIYGAYRYPLTGTRYLTQFYHSDSIIGKDTAVINFSHYGEALPGVDEYIDGARFELDQAKQIALWEAAQKQIKDDCVSFPLFTRKYAMAKSENFDQGFEQQSYSFYQVTEKSQIR
jgi:peptide/nickel transport system substrate-binding protein